MLLNGLVIVYLLGYLVNNVAYIDPCNTHDITFIFGWSCNVMVTPFGIWNILILNLGSIKIFIIPTCLPIS